jgi:predicted helicase
VSQLLINQYLNRLARLRQITGADRESQVRAAFQRLLEDWGESKKLTFVGEYDYLGPARNVCRVDGVLLQSLRAPFGWWEAKDTKDDLQDEIIKKLRKGYPQDNIIFEDGRQAVLIQNRRQLEPVSIEDTVGLEGLLKQFFGYEPETTRNFRRAVEKFKTDLPAVLGELRSRIETAYADNLAFGKAAREFLAHAKETINPAITDADVREMLIQHILTEDIFARVFNESEFHRENNVAKALYKLENLFFRGEVKKATLAALEPYYAEINATSAQIGSHLEKQRFLKAIYENFYKVYNAKAADRLGVVYTPNEIVRFMIESADWLCERHFGRNLIDRDVEILDPATGTGTFIVELLEHFRGQPEKLKHKYREELHANEVAILPYYVANLNIEATYAAIMGQYAEFPNLCFVDTLDNVAALGTYKGAQHSLLGALSNENVERVRRQNRRKISVIIGNPPYNAWQENYNQRNANRAYRSVDDRIQDTYVKEGTAQNKNSVYDMYTRFLRWASDRVAEDGVIAFIVGRKPLSKAAYDGFRKVVAREFAEVWLVDLGGDVRDNPKLSGTKHNVFGIQTGVAILFLVKRRGSGTAVIRYARRPEMEVASEKLAWLNGRALQSAGVQALTANKRHDWLNQAENAWDTLLPVHDPRSSPDRARAVFGLSSNGIETKRDEWVYDLDRNTLVGKVRLLINVYNDRLHGKAPTAAVKWDRELDKHLRRKVTIQYESTKIIRCEYRPFSPQLIYYDPRLNAFHFKLAGLFGTPGGKSPVIAFTDPGAQKPWMALAVEHVPDRHLVGAAAAATCVGQYRYVGADRIDNITDWALEQFTAHYGRKTPITKDDIFHYVYAVLHDPVYRETYALNLRREFPRVPFYPDFARWAAWGRTLMDLHIGYEALEPWPLRRTDLPMHGGEPLKKGKSKDLFEKKAAPSAKREADTPKPRLKADKDHGIIALDTQTQLSGVPPEAWAYRLGNRSAVEWVLDQHKEKKPSDPTIREKFDTYRFADHKERVIDLLGRVTRVSVETVGITEAMRALPVSARGAAQSDAAE